MDQKLTQLKALEFYKRKEFDAAIAQFSLLPPAPIVKYNIAMCYRDKGGLENLEVSRDILATLVKTRVRDGTLYNQIKEAFVALMTGIVREHALSFRLEKALAVNLESMKIIPNNAILLYNQGHLYKCLGRHQEALAYLDKSLIYNPQYFDSYIEKINVYNDARDYATVEKIIKQGIAALPGDARFYNELGVCLCRLGRVKDGFDAYETGLKLPTCNPNIAGKIYTNVGNAYSFLGDVPASLENSRKGYQTDPTNTTAMQNYLMNLLYVPNIPFTDTLKQHFEVGMLYSKQMKIPEYNVHPYEGPRNPKIHLGFVSGDFFGEHPMTYFLRALLTMWDREKFEVYCYSNQKIGVYPQYALEIQWRDIKYLDSKNVCYKVSQEDKIDILIDLAGHTAANRLDVFVNRCAHVQLSYLGYPCITGVPEIDYYIIDKTFDMRIKTIAMPHCFTHYWPSKVPAADTLRSPHHALDSDGFFILGTLNKLAKVNQTMVDMWDCLLDEFPNTKLMIRHNYVFKFRNQARVVFLEHEQSYEGHMSRYNKIDIALDTAPYSGTTTTCEAMLMGTPVLTLAERKTKTIHQNVSASLLINSGMADMVVECLDDYKRVILSLMHEIEADVNFKQTMQRKFLEGNVCNSQQYMQDFEALMTELISAPKKQ